MATNANLLAKINALATRVAALENHICPQESRIVALEARPASSVDLAPLTARVSTLETKLAIEIADQNVLEADHVPEP